jgi:serine/threonine-protein kinase HipA
MKTVVVYIYLDNEFVPAGLLDFENQGRYSHSIFRYGKKYLKRSNAISLDPVQLPLLSKEFVTEPGFDIFNGLRDAGPDRWGRYLLDKKERHALDELDYITMVSADRSGALAFADHTEGITTPIAHRLDLKLCVEAAEQALSGENTPALEAYLNYGPSLGGARPKATVLWNNKAYVAKFTLSLDKKNEALIEYATMSLAKHCGLNVPPIDKAQVSGRDVFLIERFDRVLHNDVERPIPFMSGLTATGLHEQDYTQWSYLSLCNAINKFSNDPSRDKLELFKRMVFSILVFNNDDHMRNHGFIYVGNQQWALSPLYDVVPGIINSDVYMLAMNMGDKGKEASLENALSAARYFNINDNKAKQIISELTNVVKHWEQRYKECGVSEQDTNKLRHSLSRF